MAKSFSATKKTITEAYWRVSKACDLASYLGPRVDAQNQFREAILLATRGEKEHRKMGARFTNGQAHYRGSYELAAQLIVCQHVAEALRDGVKAPASYSDVTSIRQDCALTYAIAEGILRACKPVRKPRVKATSQYAQAQNEFQAEREARTKAQRTELRSLVKLLQSHPVLAMDYAQDIAVR